MVRHLPKYTPLPRAVKRAFSNVGTPCSAPCFYTRIFANQRDLLGSARPEARTPRPVAHFFQRMLRKFMVLNKGYPHSFGRRPTTNAKSGDRTRKRPTAQFEPIAAAKTNHLPPEHRHRGTVSKPTPGDLALSSFDLCPLTGRFDPFFSLPGQRGRGIPARRRLLDPNASTCCSIADRRSSRRLGELLLVVERQKIQPIDSRVASDLGGWKSFWRGTWRRSMPSGWALMLAAKVFGDWPERRNAATVTTDQARRRIGKRIRDMANTSAQDGVRRKSLAGSESEF